MDSDILNKIRRLSPQLQERLSQDDILDQLDLLDEEYGIKSVLLLIDLILGEMDYGQLDEKLESDYGFNEFLADKIQNRLGELIKSLGNDLPTPAKINATEQTPASVKGDSSASSLTFSREDEEEIKQYLGDAASTQPEADYASPAQKVIKASGFNAGDDVLDKRLETIVISRLKGIRDDLETKENLTKSHKVGGMEMPEATADKFLGLIKDNSNGINVADFSRPVSTVPHEVPPVVAPLVMEPTIEEEDGLPVIKLPSDKQPIKPQPDQVVFPSGPEPISNDQIKLPVTAQNVKIETVKESIEPLAKAAAAIKITNLPPPRPAPYVGEKTLPDNAWTAPRTNRPTLDDVRVENKLRGPLEELENLTLIEFRRLAANPQVAVKKIKEKIDLLASEGLEKRIHGIEAWNRSEVSRFYRLLGQTAMSSSSGIEQIIHDRLMSGKPTLTLDEFQAVLELNRSLRY